MEKRLNIFNRTNLARILLLVFDVLAVNFAYYITLVIRFYVAHSIPEACLGYFDAFWKFTPYYTVASVMTFFAFKLYNSVWRYAGINDLHRIITANIITALINIIGSLIFVKRMPISYYIIGAMIQFVLICISRFSYRIYLMEVDKLSKKNINISMNVMIVGIGETAQIVRRRIDNDRSNVAKAVCVFTTKLDKKNTFFNGLPLVTGIENLEKCIEDYNINCVALADSNESSEVRQIIGKVCEQKSVEFQDFSEYFSKDADTKTMISILENVKGTVELIVGGETKVYSSGEKALNELTGGYSISDISVRDNRLLLTLSDSKKVISSPKDDWAKNTDNSDNNELSFF